MENPIGDTMAQKLAELQYFIVFITSLSDFHFRNDDFKCSIILILYKYY